VLAIDEGEPGGRDAGVGSLSAWGSVCCVR
jgi:hypothetical protein